MCGIAGFISNDRWKETADLSWLDTVLGKFEAAAASNNWEDLDMPLKELVDGFDLLMSFGMHIELVKRTEIRAKMQRLADLLIALSAKLNDVIAETGRSDFLEFLAENTRDCMWQIKEEVLHNIDRTISLFPNLSQCRILIIPSIL